MKLVLLSFLVMLTALYDVGILSYTIITADKTSEDSSVSTTTPRSLGYPNVWVINLVDKNWTASGEVGYVACRSGYFKNLEFGGTFTEWRGACLIRYIKATLTKGGKEINAATYWSSGTGYSAFEIVRWGTEDNFCVRRTSTSCS